MLGACVSLTVTVNEQLAVLPAASVTKNVLVVTPTGNVAPLARPAVCVVVWPGQLSVPAGVVYVTTAEQLFRSLACVMFDGQVMAGDCVSLTVTVNEQLAVLPAASVTKNVLVVTPTGNAAPLARPAVCVVVWPGQLSVPAGVVYVTTAEQLFRSLACVMFDGQVMAGDCVSLTVTVNEQVPVFRAASVATTFTVVVPTVKVEPEAGVATAVAPGQLSDAETENVTSAEQRFMAFGTTMLAGQFATGGWFSVTVTVNEQVPVLPAGSVAVTTTVVVPPMNCEPEAGDAAEVAEQLSEPLCENETVA